MFQQRISRPRSKCEMFSGMWRKSCVCTNSSNNKKPKLSLDTKRNPGNGAAIYPDFLLWPVI